MTRSLLFLLTTLRACERPRVEMSCCPREAGRERGAERREKYEFSEGRQPSSQGKTPEPPVARHVGYHPLLGGLLESEIYQCLSS